MVSVRSIISLIYLGFGRNLDQSFTIWIDEDMENGSYFSSNKDSFGFNDFIPGVYQPRVVYFEIWMVHSPIRPSKIRNMETMGMIDSPRVSQSARFGGEQQSNYGEYRNSYPYRQEQQDYSNLSQYSGYNQNYRSSSRGYFQGDNLGQNRAYEYNPDQRQRNVLPLKPRQRPNSKSVQGYLAPKEYQTRYSHQQKDVIAEVEIGDEEDQSESRKD